jgi:non-ribosomal peptide synthetase component F
MDYTVKIFHSEDVSPADREAAAARFRSALEASLGDASLVAPVYRAWLRLLQAHGEAARPWDLSPAEQLLADQWEAAELAATQAAFGTERYMGDAHFELSIGER